MRKILFIMTFLSHFFLFGQSPTNLPSGQYNYTHANYKATAGKPLGVINGTTGQFGAIQSVDTIWVSGDSIKFKIAGVTYGTLIQVQVPDSTVWKYDSIRNTIYSNKTDSTSILFGSDTISTAGNTGVYFNKTKLAFRVGQGIWADDSLGLGSTATGFETTATADASTAMGYETTASGNASTAMGDATTASGISSTAMGVSTTASGDGSTAMGFETTASGDGSTAMGIETTASADASTAMGDRTTANGITSTSMGAITTASGGASTAMGAYTTANGNFSTAMGSYTTATGLASTSMGDSTTANGVGSTAMGNRTTASGDASTAMGSYTTATGFASLVIGRFNDTLVGAEYAITDTTPLFIVGNGTSSSDLHNAFVVRNNGTVEIDSLPHSVSGDSIVRVGANGILTKVNSNNFWKTGGNTGLDTTAYLGTNDSASLYFKVVGVSAGKISRDSLSNNFFGKRVLEKNTTGVYNTGFGWGVLRENTTGSLNTGFGFASLTMNTTGSSNVGLGRQALYSNTTGTGNTAIGNGTMRDFSGGSSNTSVGSNAMLLSTGGNQNTAVGANALDSISGSNNTGIGYLARVPDRTASNQVRVGNFSVTYAGVQVAWTVTSDSSAKTNITPTDLGLNFINSLNPVSYNRKEFDENGNCTGFYPKKEYGLIAQDVRDALTNSGVTTDGIVTNTGDGKLAVRYNDLISVLIKAVQELTVRVEALENQ